MAKISLLRTIGFTMCLGLGIGITEVSFSQTKTNRAKAKKSKTKLKKTQRKAPSARKRAGRKVVNRRPKRRRGIREVDRFKTNLCALANRRCTGTAIMKAALETLPMRLKTKKVRRRRPKVKIAQRFTNTFKEQFDYFYRQINLNLKKKTSRKKALDVYAMLVSMEINPYELLVKEAAWQLCGALTCRKEATTALNESGLLRAQFAVKPKATIRSQFNRYAKGWRRSLISLIDTTAWVAIADRSFTAAIGLNGDVTRQHRQLRDAALMLSAGVSQTVMNEAKPTCNQKKPFPMQGGCGLPNRPDLPKTGGPAPIDPSPLAFNGAGHGPPGGVMGKIPTKMIEAPAWMLPGACYGIDPKNLFNGASTPSSDSKSKEQKGDKRSPSTESKRRKNKASKASENRQKPNKTENKTTEQSPKAKPEGVSTVPGAGQFSGTKPKSSAQRAFEGAKDWFNARREDLKVDAGPVTIDFGQSLVKTGRNAVKGTYGFTIGGTFIPTPEGELKSFCSQSFAAGMAGCMGAPPTGSSQTPQNLMCGGKIAPVSLPSGPPSTFCMCGGGQTESGSNNQKSDNGKDFGAQDCCPAFCIAANNHHLDASGYGACQSCQMGPQCGGGSGKDSPSLASLCLGGKLGEPIHSKLCGAVDPSPLSQRFKPLLKKNRLKNKMRQLKRLERRNMRR